MTKWIWIALACILNCVATPETEMARPTVSPAWATNTNYAGGPDTGTATKVAPSAGRFADGWRNDDIPPAPEQNYWQSLAATWIDWLESGSVTDTTALAALTGIPDGARIWVSGIHVPYMRGAGLGITADGFWVVTSADGGRFVHPDYSAATGQHVAYVGPVPSETTTNVTTAGRINRQFIPFGTFTQFPNNFSISQSSSSYNTSSATTVTLNSPVDTNGFAAGYRLVPEFGTVEFTASAWVQGNSAVAFNVQVWLEYSLDAGATWVPATSAAGTLSIPLTADNLPKALPLSFFLNYGAYGGSVTGRLMIRLRAISDGTGTHNLVVHIDSDMLRVTYPT